MDYDGKFANLENWYDCFSRLNSCSFSRWREGKRHEKRRERRQDTEERREKDVERRTGETRVERREHDAKFVRAAECASHPPYLQTCKYGCLKVDRNEHIRFQILISPTAQKSEFRKNETRCTAAPNYVVRAANRQSGFRPGGSQRTLLIRKTAQNSELHVFSVI